MAGLFSKTPGGEGGKYLVQRRDGTVPDWPWFVLGASDPAAPITLRVYALEHERMGSDPQYVADLRALADEFEEWRLANGAGDPDAPKHRKDDQKIVAKLKKHKGA
jgi:hypothetical protein